MGGEGLEPPVHLRSGFTVRAATNYRLPSQIFFVRLVGFEPTSSRIKSPVHIRTTLPQAHANKIFKDIILILRACFILDYPYITNYLRKHTQLLFSFHIFYF